MRLAEVVLWGSLAVALYAYGLYPLVIWLLSRARRAASDPSRAVESDALPSVTLVIRAGSDEQFIVKRLENALALDYPRDRLQILVGCSGEDDLTGLLALSFDRRLIEVVQSPKRGDGHLLNACLRQAHGDVVVVSDARTFMRSDALQRLAEHFHNAPAIGGVCGKLRVVGVSGRDLDGRFARLEDFLKRHESRWERLPDMKSEILAIRTSLFEPIGDRSPFDIVGVALAIVRRGYRFIYDDHVVATKESTQRRRFGLPAFDRRRGLIAAAFWLHRALRRLGPALLIAAFVGNACLLEDPFYLHLMLIHELFYVGALIAVCFTTGKRRRWFGLARAGRKGAPQGLEASFPGSQATL